MDIKVRPQENNPCARIEIRNQALKKSLVTALFMALFMPITIIAWLGMNNFSEYFWVLSLSVLVVVFIVSFIFLCIKQMCYKCRNFWSLKLAKTTPIYSYEKGNDSKRVVNSVGVETYKCVKCGHQSFRYKQRSMKND